MPSASSLGTLAVAKEAHADGSGCEGEGEGEGEGEEDADAKDTPMVGFWQLFRFTTPLEKFGLFLAFLCSFLQVRGLLCSRLGLPGAALPPRLRARALGVKRKWTERLAHVPA